MRICIQVLPFWLLMLLMPRATLTQKVMGSYLVFIRKLPPGNEPQAPATPRPTCMLRHTLKP